MPIHAYRAHWHAQETVAKTVLAAAHAKRTAAQGRLHHVRWAMRRQRAAAARWGEEHFRSAVATPASGPAPAITSATISNSRHASRGGPEIMSCSGESTRSVSICRRQSG